MIKKLNALQNQMPSKSIRRPKPMQSEFQCHIYSKNKVSTNNQKAQNKDYRKHFSLQVQKQKFDSEPRGLKTLNDYSICSKDKMNYDELILQTNFEFGKETKSNTVSSQKQNPIKDSKCTDQGIQTSTKKQASKLQYQRFSNHTTILPSLDNSSATIEKQQRMQDRLIQQYEAELTGKLKQQYSPELLYRLYLDNQNLAKQQECTCYTCYFCQMKQKQEQQSKLQQQYRITRVVFPKRSQNKYKLKSQRERAISFQQTVLTNKRQILDFINGKWDLSQSQQPNPRATPQTMFSYYQ